MKRISLYILSATLAFTACKKETESMPYADIEQFIIKDASGADLKGVINGTEVVLYWPPYNDVPANITPQITVSTAAKVSPASGESVAFKDGALFTVTAQNGVKKLYTLKTVVNEPTPVVEDIGTNFFLTMGGTLNMFGTYLVGKDSSATKIYVIDKEKKETELDNTTATVFTAGRIMIPFPLKVGVDTGYYQVKFVIGKFSYTMKDKVYLNPPTTMSVMEPAAGETMKKGQLFTFKIHEMMAKYWKGGDITSVRIYATNASITTLATDVVFTPTSITFRVPADISFDVSPRVRFYNAAGTMVAQFFNSVRPISIQ
jgi:hypothetical protein